MDYAYSINLHASQLLYTAELLTIQYVAAMKGARKINPEIYSPTLPYAIIECGTKLITLSIAANLANDIGELLRSILRQPLRDSRFRQQFNELFRTHPVFDEEARMLLDELLIWE